MPTSQPQSRLITLSCCSYFRADPDPLADLLTNRPNSSSPLSNLQCLIHPTPADPESCPVHNRLLDSVHHSKYNPTRPQFGVPVRFSIEVYFPLVCTESVATSYHSALVRTFFFVPCTLRGSHDQCELSVSTNVQRN